MKNCYVDARENGTMRVRVIVNIDGEKIRTSTTYYPDSSLTAKENLKAAEALGVAFMEEIKKEYEEEKERRNPTFRQFYEEVYLNKAKTKIADTTYEFNLNTNEKFFLPTFGDIKLKVISKKMLQDKIQALVNKENENLEDPRPILSQTAERYVSAFRAVISMAVREGLLERDPFEGGMVYPKMYMPIIKCLNKNDYTYVLTILHNCVTKSNCISEIEVIISLGLLAGLRRGELVALQWGDIENLSSERLDSCRICVNASAYKIKGQKQQRGNPKSVSGKRCFVIPKLLAEILLVWKNLKISRGVSVSPRDYVIASINGEMISLGTPNRWVAKYFEKQGLENVKLHSLRHTFAAVLIRAKMDIETLREIMGHDDIRTTQIYLYFFKLQEDLMSDVNSYNDDLIAQMGGNK